MELTWTEIPALQPRNGIFICAQTENLHLGKKKKEERKTSKATCPSTRMLPLFWTFHRPHCQHYFNVRICQQNAHCIHYLHFPLSNFDADLQQNILVWSQVAKCYIFIDGGLIFIYFPLCTFLDINTTFTPAQKFARHLGVPCGLTCLCVCVRSYLL